MKIKSIGFSSLTCIAVLAGVNAADSQVLYDGVMTSYSQNFDSLGTGGGTWADNSTLLGWYLNRTGSAAIPLYASLNITPGNVGTGGNTNVYNVGLAGSAANRALGWYTYNNTTIGNEYIGLQIQNSSGSDFIGTITLSLTYEQWQGTNNDPLSLQYQANVTGTGNQLLNGVWATVSTLNSPNVPTDGARLNTIGINGQDPGNQVPGTEAVTFTSASPWIAGEYLWFRAYDNVTNALNQTGNTRNDLNAIDNVSVNFSASAVPEPSSWALLGLGMFGLVRVFRRRASAKYEYALAEMQFKIPPAAKCH